MKRIFISILASTTLFASPAMATHVFDRDDPYPSRGECESSLAELDNVDREFLQTQFPNLFLDSGDARAFIARAWTCEQNEDDGLWYFKDRRSEVLASDWWKRRLN